MAASTLARPYFEIKLSLSVDEDVVLSCFAVDFNEFWVMVNISATTLRTCFLGSNVTFMSVNSLISFTASVITFF